MSRTCASQRPAELNHAALQCAAIAEAGASAGKPLDGAAFLAAIKTHVTTPGFQDAVTAIGELVQRRASPAEIAARLGSDISALGSVPTAIALFLRSADDLKTALVSAVHAGGDTDTVASMAGAIAGARLGQAGLPSRLVSRLEKQQQIVALADHVATLVAI